MERCSAWSTVFSDYQHPLFGDIRPRLTAPAKPTMALLDFTSGTYMEPAHPLPDHRCLKNTSKTIQPRIEHGQSKRPESTLLDRMVR